VYVNQVASINAGFVAFDAPSVINRLIAPYPSKNTAPTSA
jgi:hypothetical protein